MSPQEFWNIVEVRQPPKMIGAMKKDTFDELRAMLHTDEENVDA